MGQEAERQIDVGLPYLKEKLYLEAQAVVLLTGALQCGHGMLGNGSSVA